MYSNRPKSPLIVDINDQFIFELTDNPQAKHNPPLIARTGKEAQLIIANSEIQIAGVFVNPGFYSDKRDNGPGPISVIKFSKKHRMSVPIYILNGKDENDELVKLDFHELGVKQVLEFPITYTMILELVAPHVITFDPLKKSKAKVDRLDSEVNDQDSDFIAIRAADFVSGSISHFSVYAKTGSGRYLKILHAQDAFDPKRLESYRKKGVDHFYIRKEDQEQHLKFVAQISNNILNKNLGSVSIQAAQTLNYGQETIQFLQDQGISESRLSHAANFVGNIREVVSKMANENTLISKLMEDLIGYEHGVSVSMITSLMAHHTGIESANAVQIVGISSLLHDLGLVGAELGLEYEDISKMTKEQLEMYYAHPRVGSEMMAKVPGTHPTVIQAIAQHHERRGAKAFDPTATRPKAISGIAEMIGLANEYLDLAHKIKTDSSIDIKQYMEKEVYRGFSIDTVEAFKKALFPSANARKRGFG